MPWRLPLKKIYGIDKYVLLMMHWEVQFKISVCFQGFLQTWKLYFQKILQLLIDSFLIIKKFSDNAI